MRGCGVEREVDIRKLFASKISFKFLTVLQNRMFISRHLYVVRKTLARFGVRIKASEAPDINNRCRIIH